MRINFHGTIRKTSSGSYFVVIPKERIIYYCRENNINSVLGREVKVEVEL